MCHACAALRGERVGIVCLSSVAVCKSEGNIQSNMLRMRSSLKQITDVFFDLENEEGRLLFSVKSQIERFIKFDENFNTEAGHLKVYTDFSKNNNMVMLTVEAQSCIFRFGKVEALRLLSYEPLFKNHVLMTTNRQITGRL